MQLRGTNERGEEECLFIKTMCVRTFMKRLANMLFFTLGYYVGLVYGFHLGFSHRVELPEQRAPRPNPPSTNPWYLEDQVPE